MERAKTHDRTDLMWGMLRGFSWLERCLQENLAARGWPPNGGTESQIMTFVAVGIDRPAEIARRLGMSRQAIHKATKVLIERQLVRLDDDPTDGRGKVIVFAPEGAAHRDDATEIVEQIMDELETRLGARRLSTCAKTLRLDWGEFPIFEPRSDRAHAEGASGEGS